MSLKNPLVESDNNSDDSEILEISYEEQPTRPIDYVLILGLMFSTYAAILGLFFGLVNWATDSGNTLANNYKYYHENMYFNLCLFIVYMVALGSFWFFGVKKRDQYRQQLMDKQLALKEGLK